MSIIELARTPRIIAGVGARERIAGLAGAGPALLVADPGLKSTGLVEEVAGSLRKQGVRLSIFESFQSDPTVAQTDAAAAIARDQNAQSRRSASAAAPRLISARRSRRSRPLANSAVHYQLGANPLPKKSLRKICVPTTSGTGSETTRTAIRDARRSCQGLALGRRDQGRRGRARSRADGEPASGDDRGDRIDALVHAVEAATNRNANPAAGLYAHEAIRLVARHLVTAVENPRNLEARAALQWAAAFAGVAIDNCGTAIAHALGHAMGSLRPIHHGRAVGIAMLASLPWNVEDNDAFAACALDMGGEPSARGFIAAYEKLLRASGLKLSVAEEFAGVTPRTLAEQTARPENAAMRDSQCARGERERSPHARARNSLDLIEVRPMLDRPTTKDGWLARAAALKIETRAFIDGAYADAASGARFKRVSPIDGRVFAEVADCGEADIDRAVSAARRAFEAGVWRDAAPTKKKRVLLRFAELIREHADELALLETLDVGKTIGNALGVDVPFCADCIQYYAELADKLVRRDRAGRRQGRRADPPRAARRRRRDRPLELSPHHRRLEDRPGAGGRQFGRPEARRAIAARARSSSAGSAQEAGLPAGVLNVVPGFGERAGKPLALHPRRRHDHASPARPKSASSMLRYAGESNMKRVVARMRRQEPACRDGRRGHRSRRRGDRLGHLSTIRARPATPARGCSSIPLCAPSSWRQIAEVARAQIPIGHPFEAASQMGALIEESHMRRVLGYIELGQKEGAKDRARRPARDDGDRRLLCRADHPRRRAQRHAHRAGGDFRPGRRRHPLRGRRPRRSSSPTTASTASAPRSGHPT